MADSNSLFAAQESSVVVRITRRLRSSYTSIIGSSTVVVGLSELAGELRTAGSTAVIGRTGAWVRSSFLYRWLTAPPEAEVVVIDLRRTWTIGPFLAILDWLTEIVSRPWSSSDIGDLARRSVTAFEQSPVRLLGIFSLTAVGGNTLIELAIGSLSPSDLGLRLVLLAPAIAAIRVDTSLADLRESLVGRAVVALVEPPDPPEGKP